jgi:hypothetical protein
MLAFSTARLIGIRCRLTTEHAVDAARMLAQINDPIGVRYMRQVLTQTERVDPIILMGLFRIDSDAARAVLAEAAQSSSERRAQAKGFLLQLLSRR